MQHLHASCQLRVPETGYVAPETTLGTEHTPARRRKVWAPEPSETVACTTSRRTGPRAWLRALERAVDAGLVPGFNATTQAIIGVIASRMDYDTGHARYVMRDVMERTGLGRTAVTDHVKVLRSAGWLAWAEHGSLRNALRNLGKPGYAKTATVYAATIPPAFDHLMGHIVVGSGYDARIIVDHRPGAAVENAVDTAGTTAVENPGGQMTRTPSLWVDKEEGQVQVVGGKDGSTANAAVTKSRRKRKLTVTGYKITGERIERARRLAVSVRPLVNWLQGATHDELSWVLLDLVARDWSDSRITLWLGKLGQDIGAARRRPRAPHRVIAAALRRKDREDATSAVPADLEAEEYQRPAAPNAAFDAARAAVRRHREPMAEYPTLTEIPVFYEEILEQREAAELDPGLVRATARIAGRDEALRMFGPRAAEILEAALLVTI
jgi:hypothetical protein